MLIHRLTLSDENLPGQWLFYTLTSGFSPIICSDNAFTTKTSPTGLTFNWQDAGENPAYHFAYTLSKKQLSGAETGHTNAADKVENREQQTVHENGQKAGTGVKGLEPENGFQLSVQVASVQVQKQWPASFSRSTIAPEIRLLRQEKGTYRCIGFIQENVEIRQ